MSVNISRLALAGTLSLVSLSVAQAHVTLEAGEAAAGGSYRAVMRVPHGCDGAATTAIRVQVPEGFFSVKPMPHAGWTLSTETGAYDNTYMNHGKPVSEGVREVSWTDGDLPDAYYDEFVMRGTLAPDLEAGTALAFPVIQTCADGSEIRWTGEGDDPAPELMITAQAAGDDHQHGHQHEHAMAEPAGDLEITGAFARATLPGAPVGGGFLTIANHGDEDDRLIVVKTDVAGEAQLHNMRIEGEVMKMYQMADGITIPAGETVTLAPGGLHIMLMKLNGPLVEGDSFDLELTFEKAGTLTVPVKIEGIAAKGTDHAGHAGHGDMKMK
ncbi:DUF1775 domain-containing protein [Martelella limonii]|uniref:DUF1775 domain-containing protein n=1 Tax=Martelella limonii TaxID=1647649 RepID=UPI0015803E98|nr:DUF1775 domain-containing protein [Martelella limonii]